MARRLIACWSSRSADGTGVRTSARNAGNVFSVADPQLCGAGSVGEVQWGSAAMRTYQQAAQYSAAFPASGSSPVGEKDRQSSDGPETSGVTVLDVPSHGTARKSPGCAEMATLHQLPRIGHQREGSNRAPAEFCCVRNCSVCSANRSKTTNPVSTGDTLVFRTSVLGCKATLLPMLTSKVV